MQRRRLNGTDIDCSRVVIGTMTFGSQVGPDTAQAMVETCLDAGVTMFDTANSYNNGRSEEILGQLLRGRREGVHVATKVANRVGLHSDDAGLSKTAIFKAIDASLERLQTDYVDLYYLHKPDPSIPLEESLEALDELVTAGKVRYGASSNYAAWQIADMHSLASQRHWAPLQVSQPLYNLLARRIEDEYTAFSLDHSISNVVYNPLAGGLLTGKHQRDAKPGEGSRFTNERYRQRYWNDAQFVAVAELARIADQAGLTLVELAFKWLLSRPVVEAVILGASSVAQLESNLAACAQPSLSAEIAEQCDNVWQRLRGAAPNYNR